MSNKNTRGAAKRPYRQKLRARRVEETRLRITEALVELHRTVGPARTTVSEVAQQAGVRRMTVYNHFPTELDMIDACSSHWVAGHPPPDPDEWAKIEDAGGRRRRGLEQLYRYYRRNRDMVGNFVRDAPLVPALAEILGKRWLPVMDRMATVLETDRDLAAPARERERAAIRIALDFGTWRILADRGQDDESAARLVSNLIEAAEAASDED
jgi:AcrR family transcriptional regulator